MSLSRRTLPVLLLAALAQPASAAAGSRVVSSARPALTLEVDEAFRRLAAMAFPIEKLTDARREVFIDAMAGGEIRRAVIVQFETVQKGSDFRFVYPSRPPQRFGAETYRFGAYVYDDARAAAANPGKEAALTRGHLAAQGLKPPRLWRVARLARVTDPDGLTEVIVFYLENADALYPPGPLPGADEDGDLSLDEAGRAAIFERLKAVVKVISG